MARDEKDPGIRLIDRSGLQDQVDQLREIGERRVRPTPQERPRQEGDRSTRRGDRFRLSSAIDRFVSTIRSRLERGGGEAFRLPGSRRPVTDRRHQRPGDPSKRAHHRSVDTTPMQTRDGALVADRQATGQSSQAAQTQRSPMFTDRTTIRPHQQLPQQQAGMGEALEKALSKFEQKIVARFEGAEEQAKSTEDGQPKFLKKSAAQWLGFLKKFMHRTVKKQAPFSALAEGLLFRGLLQQKGKSGKGMLIGDFQFTNGQVDKFARMSVQLPQLLAQMQGMRPGMSLPKQVLAAGVEGEMLEYLALVPPKGEHTKPLAMKERGGIFTSLRTEAAVAARLGIAQAGTEMRNVEEEVGGERVAARRGILARWFGESEGEGEAAGEDVGRFVPWWRWDREERGGMRRWFVSVTLTVLIIALVIGTWLLWRGSV